MMTLRHPVDPDTALDQAARWLAKFAAGEVSASERADFQEWLAADPEHQRAYGEAQATWCDLDALAGLASTEGEALPAPLRHEVERCNARANLALAGSLRRSRARWLAVAATLVMGVLGLMVLQRGQPHQASPLGTTLVLKTRVGERTQTALTDGSLIWLNTDTELRVAFSAAARQVEMVGGEAYFEVAKDPARPFVVSVGNRTITAVGTAFNVFSRDGETRVTVLEGKVEVRRRVPPGLEAAVVGATAETAPDSPRAPEPLPPQPVAAAQMAIIDEASTFVAALEPEAVSRQGTWRQGVLYFDHVTLAEIVAQLDPYLPARIVIADPAIGEFVGGGVVHVDSAESILTAITRVWPVEVRRESPDFVVLTRRR
jgi:transmembrane sensor